MELIERLLLTLSGVRQTGPNQWEAKCPAHDDRQASLAISIGEDGRVLCHCHAGCTLDEICREVGLAVGDLFPPRESPNGNGKPRRTKGDWGDITAYYNYRDEQGAMLFQVCRFEKPLTNGRVRKTFRQRSPKPDGGWSWKAKDARKVLYRLPELLASTPETPVVIVEGEKDVERLRKLGVTATCNPGGAGKWSADYSTSLEGRRVVILPDNDRPGMDHAAYVAERLADVAAAIKIVELPDLPPKGDVSDWLDAGGTAERLAAVIKAAPLYEPPVKPEDLDPLEQDREICARLGLDVLGERPGQEILVFSLATRKLSEVAKIGGLNLPQLIQIAGPRVRELVYHGDADNRPPGAVHFDRVREAIAAVGGSQRIHDDQSRGIGVWRGQGEELVLVNRTYASTWHTVERRLTRVETPRASGLLLDLHAGGRWYDHDRLAGHLAAAADVAWRQTALDELTAALAQWNWRHGRRDAECLAGLVLATYLQTCLRWRPLISLACESGAGKSTLLELLSRVFGELAFFVAKPSEAGIRQNIHQNAPAILIDELESGRHREGVLRLLRTSGTGSKLPRGTAGQHGIMYGLRHICWVASIESGLVEQADRNRYLKFEFAPPEERHRKAFCMPAEAELADLGDRLLAVALYTAAESLPLAERLRRQRLDGIDARAVDSLAVPAAMLSAAMGLADAAGCPESILGQFAELIDPADREAENDQEQLMHAILGSILSLDHGRQASVSQAIAANDWPALDRVGITVAADRRGPANPAENAYERDWLFVDHRTVARHLLGRTRWADRSIDQILMRLPGAERRRMRIQGRRAHGIALPWQSFVEQFCEQGSDPLF